MDSSRDGEILADQSPWGRYEDFRGVLSNVNFFNARFSIFFLCQSYLDSVCSAAPLFNILL